MASRFYLSSTTTTPVTPAFAAWSRTSEADRREMSPTKDASAATSKTMWAGAAAAANESCLNRQYVSRPMASGIAFVTTDTIKMYVRSMESAVNDNINRQPICVKVVSSDGNTIRATLKALGHIGPNTTEWISGTLTNKTVADGDTLDANYTTVDGDRLVVEAGGQASSAGGTSVTGTQSFGSDNASDLGENETDTTALNPWFEISRTVTFSTIPLAFKSGSYTGDGAGGGKALTGLGFVPIFVIVKSRGAFSTYCRTAAMAADSAKPIGGGTFVTGLITALGSDGFTVDGTLNTNTVTYDYAAFGGDETQINAATYVGNGADDRNITWSGGFSPGLVMTWGDDANASIFRTSDEAGDHSEYTDGGALTNFIQGFNSTGFQVGSDSQVNGNGVTKYYVAILTVSGVFKPFTFTGDGNDDRNITGMGMTPDFGMLRHVTSFKLQVRFKDQTGDSSGDYDAAATTDRIQALSSDTVQVGATMNTNLAVHLGFVAAAAVVAAGQPTRKRLGGVEHSAFPAGRNNRVGVY